MKQIFLFILIFPLLTVSAQKVEKSYIMNVHEEGFLFFIFPQPIFKTSGDISKKDLIFDLTYLTKRDSLSFTATYTTKISFSADSIYIQDSENNIISSPLQLLFVDKKSSQWIHRIRFTIPFELLDRLYASESSYKIYIISNGNRIEYRYANKEWKKRREKMSEILEIIKINKKATS